MATTRVSTKGQVVIPSEIRRRPGWGAGAQLVIEDHGAYVLLRPALEVPETKLADLVGCTGYSGPRRTLADMEEAIAEGARRTR